MEGEIQISFRREPNFFSAAALQGPFFQVIAARDTETGEIIGSGTRAVRKRYVNGEARAVGYLADLRLDKRYRSGVLVARAYRYLQRLHQDAKTALYFTLVAEENETALKTIARGRAGLPPYRDLGRIHTPAVNLLRRKAGRPRDVEIVRGAVDRLPEIVDCINRNHRRRQFAPFYEVEDFSARLPGFRIEDFYVALRNGRVTGVVGKWDQRALRQTVVTGYRVKARFLRPLYNFVSSITGGPVYPPPGAELRYFYASFIAIDDDDIAVFRALMRALFNDHAGSSYDYFVVGLHEKDPLGAVLDEFSLTPFAARLFAVHFDDGADLFRSLNGMVPYVELALV
ncbi:MAG TPA: hypothetical protein VNL14_06565 [Candidatus Acidoferrales bacterium]|nr:hypothetical protein [Candidatus Acidoferrales bacterium]